MEEFPFLEVEDITVLLPYLVEVDIVVYLMFNYKDYIGEALPKGLKDQLLDMVDKDFKLDMDYEFVPDKDSMVVQDYTSVAHLGKDQKEDLDNQSLDSKYSTYREVNGLNKYAEFLNAFNFECYFTYIYSKYPSSFYFEQCFKQASFIIDDITVTYLHQFNFAFELHDLKVVGLNHLLIHFTKWFQSKVCQHFYFYGKQCAILQTCFYRCYL